MSPITHLLASWIIATKTTNNVRDARLVTLAGILPDADGFGLVWDMVKDPSGSINGSWMAGKTVLFQFHFSSGPSGWQPNAAIPSWASSIGGWIASWSMSCENGN